MSEELGPKSPEEMETTEQEGQEAEGGPVEPPVGDEESPSSAPAGGDSEPAAAEAPEADPNGAGFSEIEIEIPGGDEEAETAEEEGQVSGGEEAAAEEDGIEVVIADEGQEEGEEPAKEEPKEAPEGQQPQESDQGIPEEEALEKAFDAAMADDELWDESGDLEDIPLFQELEKRDSKEEAQGEGASSEGAAAPAEGDSKEEETTAEEEEFKRRPADDEALTITIPDSWLPFAGGGAGVLALAALFLLWHIAATPPPNISPTPAKQVAQAVQGVKPTAMSSEQVVRSKQVESLALVPFLIPATRNGELVFFKLQVELVTDSETTKHALMRKEAWVRDIIYSKLKGIDLSNGVAGNILLRYRKPIIERINKELKPLHVDDIRMVGVLLR